MKGLFTRKKSVQLEGQITYDDGTVCHYRNGKLHNMDGPAVVQPDGYRSWHVNGQLRAVEHPDGRVEEKTSHTHSWLWAIVIALLVSYAIDTFISLVPEGG